MTFAIKRHLARARGIALGLALMAVALKVLIPSGFMMDLSGQGPAALVLCTAQGMTLVDPSDTAPPKSVADNPCAFSGHGIGAAAVEDQSSLTSTAVAYWWVAPSHTPGVTPGFGLAAPPLPARGPPQTI